MLEVFETRGNFLQIYSPITAIKWIAPTASNLCALHFYPRNRKLRNLHALLTPCLSRLVTLKDSQPTECPWDLWVSPDSAFPGAFLLGVSEGHISVSFVLLKRITGGILFCWTSPFYSQTSWWAINKGGRLTVTCSKEIHEKLQQLHLQSSAVSFPVTRTLRGTPEINLSASAHPRCWGQRTHQEVSRIFLRINHKLGETTDGGDLFGCLFPGVMEGLVNVINSAFQPSPVSLFLPLAPPPREQSCHLLTSAPSVFVPRWRHDHVKWFLA